MSHTRLDTSRVLRSLYTEYPRKTSDRKNPTRLVVSTVINFHLHQRLVKFVESVRGIESDHSTNISKCHIILLNRRVEFSFSLPSQDFGGICCIERQ